jgi:acetyltransferase
MKMIVNELIAPRSIVIIGASNDVEKPGGKILKNIIDGGFRGNLSAVNPKEEIVQGVRCFKDVNQIENVELAILANQGKSSSNKSSKW